MPGMKLIEPTVFSKSSGNLVYRRTEGQTARRTDRLTDGQTSGWIQYTPIPPLVERGYNKNQYTCYTVYGGLHCTHQWHPYSCPHFFLRHRRTWPAHECPNVGITMTTRPLQKCVWVLKSESSWIFSTIKNESFNVWARYFVWNLISKGNFEIPLKLSYLYIGRCQV